MPIKTITSRAFNQDASGAKRASRDGPVIITERGRPAHVLLSYAEFEQLMKPRRTLADVFSTPHPADDVDVEFTRLEGLPRDVDLT